MIRDTSAQDQVMSRPVGASRARKWLLPGAIAAAVVVGIVVVAIGWSDSATSVNGDALRIAEVTRGRFVRDAAVNGKVVAAFSPTLYTPVNATVSLKIQAGATVKRGDILAELAAPELSNELLREQAKLMELRAQANSAGVTAEQARLVAGTADDEAGIALQAAVRSLESAQRAYDAGVMAKVDLMKEQDTLESAKIRQRNADAGQKLTGRSTSFDVETKRQQAQGQQLMVDDMARRVDELKVRSPIDGIVGTVSVVDRATVAPNAALMTVVDLTRLEVELSVPESYADDMGLGMPVDVSIGGATVQAKLSAISPEVVGNSVVVRARFEGKQPPGLRQNQRVSARIRMDERDNVLMVTRGPFLEQGGGRVAYGHGRQHRRPPPGQDRRQRRRQRRSAGGPAAGRPGGDLRFRRLQGRRADQGLALTPARSIPPSPHSTPRPRENPPC